ncbi:hypothetical protein PR202_ga30130 [Eleusine coracana subsp. coracana]|uniref:Uncharacterized protein n=1 Tax=Eleusine coracana subsp. coracana TaxID=191504 RepID=A0AAV5DNW8_ELECO|nr:hypothetical protein PR202_ga30130 [Eleusine coracana subsp. coracana]
MRPSITYWSAVFLRDNSGISCSDKLVSSCCPHNLVIQALRNGGIILLVESMEKLGKNLTPPSFLELGYYGIIGTIVSSMAGSQTSPLPLF